MRILHIPSHPSSKEFQFLRRTHDLKTINFRDQRLYFRWMTRYPRSSRHIFEKARRIADKFASQGYDCFIGNNTGGILWAILLRLSGFPGRLLVYADYNPCEKPIALFCFLLSQVARTNDCILTGSEVSCQAFRCFGLNSQKLFFYGLDARQFHCHRPSWLGSLLGFEADQSTYRSRSRKRFGLPMGARLFVYTGRGALDKNICTLIDAFATTSRQRTDTGLVIATIFNDPEYMQQCRWLARNQPNVYFLENLHGSSLARLYQCSDIFITCATSIFETFGRSPFEAMACGIPVVVTNYNGFKEHITNDMGIKIPVFTNEQGLKSVKEADVAQAMTQALDELGTQRSIQQIQHNLEFVKSFHCERSHAKLLTLLEVLATESRPREVDTELREKCISVEGYHRIIGELFSDYRDLPLGQALAGVFRDGEESFKLSGFDEYLRFIFHDF